MKNTSLVFLLVLLNVSSYAQVMVGRGLTYKNSKSESEALKQLKNTTLIIPVPNSQVSRIDELEKIYSEVWTLTPVELIEYREFESFKGKEGYSFLSYEYETKLTISVGAFNTLPSAGTRCNLYMHIWMYDTEPKNPDKPEILHLGVIDLTTEYDQYFENRFIHFTSDKDRIAAFYNDSITFPNSQPGFIKNYLKLINEYLEAEKQVKYTTKLTKDEANKLKSSTLYVPDYLLGKLFFFKDSEPKQANPDELMSEYKYDYEFISMKDLSEMILKSDDTFYYALYVLNPCKGGGRFFIVNNETGNIIFAKTKMSSVSSSDFQQIIK